MAVFLSWKLLNAKVVKMLFLKRDGLYLAVISTRDYKYTQEGSCGRINLTNLAVDTVED